jgi:nucleoside-triphosphatase THEP1
MAPKKRIFLITGAPGTGKTTVVSKTITALKAQDLAVGGMIAKKPATAAPAKASKSSM